MKKTIQLRQTIFIDDFRALHNIYIGNSGGRGLSPANYLLTL